MNDFLEIGCVCVVWYGLVRDARCQMSNNNVVRSRSSKSRNEVQFSLIAFDWRPSNTMAICGQVCQSEWWWNWRLTRDDFSIVYSVASDLGHDLSLIWTKFYFSKSLPTYFAAAAQRKTNYERSITWAKKRKKYSTEHQWTTPVKNFSFFFSKSVWILFQYMHQDQLRIYFQRAQNKIIKKIK